jgi:DNA-binding NarL/FixJ family response regulator
MGGVGRAPVRVAIVDDHPIARYGIEHVLAQADGLSLAASAASPSELDPGQADVVVMDLYLDGDQPALAALGEIATTARVLVMSASVRPADVLGAIRAGAAGYLTKQSDVETLVAAIETVAAGGFWLSSQLADIMRSELRAPAPAGQRAAAGVLSPREEEALAHIASGFTHAQTAARMGISKATVDTYVERIRVKMQVGNKAQLTRLALERRDRL